MTENDKKEQLQELRNHLTEKGESKERVEMLVDFLSDIFEMDFTKSGTDKVLQEADQVIKEADEVLKQFEEE